MLVSQPVVFAVLRVREWAVKGAGKQEKVNRSLHLRKVVCGLFPADFSGAVQGPSRAACAV